MIDAGRPLRFLALLLGGCIALRVALMWPTAEATRLDLGPRAEARVPIAGERVRLGLEWPQRIAGNARPGSGPALTLGADF